MSKTKDYLPHVASLPVDTMVLPDKKFYPFHRNMHGLPLAKEYSLGQSFASKIPIMLP